MQLSQSQKPSLGSLPGFLSWNRSRVSMISGQPGAWTTIDRPTFSRTYVPEIVLYRRYSDHLGLDGPTLDTEAIRSPSKVILRDPSWTTMNSAIVYVSFIRL